MNYPLSVTIELLEQAAWGLRFRETTRNDSALRLVLPFHRITGLRFGSKETRSQAEWYTSCLVSGWRGGITLQPGDSWSVEWRVRPRSVESPLVEPEDLSDFDYRRWCIELEPGEYLVWCQRCVDEDYFDPDSHMVLADLERLAEQESATVWRGQVLSNRLHLNYT